MQKSRVKTLTAAQKKCEHKVTVRMKVSAIFGWFEFDRCLGCQLEMNGKVIQK